MFWLLSLLFMLEHSKVVATYYFLKNNLRDEFFHIITNVWVLWACFIFVCDVNHEVRFNSFQNEYLIFSVPFTEEFFFFHICIASGSFLEKSVDHRNEWFYLGWLMCSVAKLCPALCYPMDYRLPGSSVHEIFQARVLEWVDISFFRGYSWPRDLPASPPSPGLARKFFTTWPSWESPSP